MKFRNLSGSADARWQFAYACDRCRVVAWTDVLPEGWEDREVDRHLCERCVSINTQPQTDLSPFELQVVGRLLRLAGEEFGNHGCNDFDLPDTPEAKALIADVGLWGGDDESCCPGDDTLMEYFADRIDDFRCAHDL